MQSVKSGIGGWLVVFIVWLFVVGVLAIYQTMYSDSFVIAAVDFGGGMLALASFVLLVVKNKLGPLLSKTYLVVNIAMACLNVVISATHGQAIDAPRQSLFYVGAISTAWLTYLTVSTRVRNTFRTAAS